MNTFAKNLKILMEERGVSAAVLAKAVAVPKSTMSEWLAGRKPMLDDSIVRLARFFGVSVERLITGAEPEQELIKEFLEQADSDFITIHKGIYRFQLEKFIGKKPISKGKKT